MARPIRNNQRPIITASEVAEFVFCAKAWRLKRQGAKAQSPRLGAGKAFHEKHGAQVSLAGRLQRVGSLCAWIFLALLVVLALMWRAEIATK
jgi:hypothetical protein